MTLLILKNVGKSYEMQQVNAATPFVFSQWNEKWVLQDVSFSLEPGDRLGVVGENGAGKSTLLRLIAGTASPTEGEIEINGEIAAILSIETQFVDKLTGRQNADSFFARKGFARTGIDEAVSAVEDFSQLSLAFDEPYHSYSSGMKARLAFACVTHLTPDLLLIDEALSVGDMAFSIRARDRIRSLISEGTAVIIVSHDLDTLSEICNRMLWIREGRVKMLGDPAFVLDNYRSFMRQSRQALGSKQGMDVTANTATEFGVRALSISNNKSQSGTSIETGDAVDIVASLSFASKPTQISARLTLQRNDGLIVIDESKIFSKPEIRSVEANSEIVIRLDRFGINEGVYTVIVEAEDQNGVSGQASLPIVVRRNFSDADQPIWYEL